MRTTMVWAYVSAVCGIAMCSATVLGAGGAPDENAQEKKIAELEAHVETLAAIIEGTARPINLGRTSLARVSASSVNGGRPLANKFYGVVNAFDNGANWHNNINYTYWLSGGDPRPWIEVVFDEPVSVTSIAVEGAPPFTARLAFAKGGEQVGPVSEDRLVLDATAHGVSKVRITFEQAGGNIRVHEVRVMGCVPPGVEYVERGPRVLVTDREAQTIAEEAYRAWTQTFLPYASTPKVSEQDGTITFTFHRHGADFVRIVVDMSSGEVKVEPLLDLPQPGPDAAADPPSDVAPAGAPTKDDQPRR